MAFRTFTLFKVAFPKSRTFPQGTKMSKVQWDKLDGSINLDIELNDVNTVRLEIQHNAKPVVGFMVQLSRSFPRRLDTPSDFPKILYSQKQGTLRYISPVSPQLHEAFQVIFANTEDCLSFVNLMKRYFNIVEAPPPKANQVKKLASKKIVSASVKKRTIQQPAPTSDVTLTTTTERDTLAVQQSNSETSQVGATSVRPPSMIILDSSHDTSNGDTSCSVTEANRAFSGPNSTHQSPAGTHAADRTFPVSTSGAVKQFSQLAHPHTDTTPHFLTQATDDPIARLKQDLLKGFVPTDRSPPGSVPNTLQDPQTKSVRSDGHPELPDESQPAMEETQISLTGIETQDRSTESRGQASSQSHQQPTSTQLTEAPNLMDEPLITFSPDMPPNALCTTVTSTTHVTTSKSIIPTSSESYISTYALSFEQLYPPIVDERKRKRDEDDDLESGEECNERKSMPDSILLGAKPSEGQQEKVDRDLMGRKDLDHLLRLSQGSGIYDLAPTDLKKLIEEVLLEQGFSQLCNRVSNVVSEYMWTGPMSLLGVPGPRTLGHPAQSILPKATSHTYGIPSQSISIPHQDHTVPTHLSASFELPSQLPQQFQPCLLAESMTSRLPYPQPPLWSSGLLQGSLAYKPTLRQAGSYMSSYAHAPDPHCGGSHPVHHNTAHHPVSYPYDYSYPVDTHKVNGGSHTQENSVHIGGYSQDQDDHCHIWSNTFPARAHELHRPSTVRLNEESGANNHGTPEALRTREEMENEELERELDEEV